MGENPRISQLEEVATKSTAMDGIKKTTVLPTLNESDGSVNNMSSPSKTNSENEILVLSQNNSGVESDIRTRKSDRVSGNLKRKYNDVVPESDEAKLQIFEDSGKVICPKYSKRLPYLLAASMGCIYLAVSSLFG